jgi:tRNA 2-thiocytidine biosynthesis protein TtcA
VLDVLINLRRSAPSQLGDSSLFDFSNLRVERDTELHIPAIQVVNL